MNEFQSLNHTLWERKYPLVWIPKYRRRVLYGDLRKHLGGVLRELAVQRESNILEGHLMKDHLHNAHFHPTKVFSGTGGRLHEGQERHPDCENFQEA